MSIIESHNVTLHGKTKDYVIKLCPLCDEHLSVLYKWNADPDVLYWTDGEGIDMDNVDPIRRVHSIYGNISKNAYCFLINVDDIPIGDCWLQEMNFPEVTKHYLNLEVKRIDIAIGEKDWWNKGVGTATIGMLTDFGFIDKRSDVIFNFISVLNSRSIRAFEKNGYKPTTDVVFNDLEENKGYHCVLTKDGHKPYLAYELIKKDI